MSDTGSATSGPPRCVVVPSVATARTIMRLLRLVARAGVAVRVPGARVGEGLCRVLFLGHGQRDQSDRPVGPVDDAVGGGAEAQYTDEYRHQGSDGGEGEGETRTQAHGRRTP